MIYTSYFAKLRALPKGVVPISICAKVPDWYSGLQYKKLAPKWSFFSVWKETHDGQYYVDCYGSQVLSGLDAGTVVSELKNLAASDDIALICYEKLGDFCHRHLVAEWLLKNGFECIEFTG